MFVQYHLADRTKKSGGAAVCNKTGATILHDKFNGTVIFRIKLRWLRRFATSKIEIEKAVL